MRVTLGAESDAVWSPDGRELVFTDSSGNVRRRVLGKNDDELLLANGDRNYPQDWTPDGVVDSLDQRRRPMVYRLPLSGSRRPELLRKKPLSERISSVFHRTVAGIAFNSLESGRWEVYAAAFPSFTDKRQVSRGGGGQPVWRRDGKELFYLSLQGKLMAVETTAGATFEASDAKSLFQTPISMNPLMDRSDVTRDGQRFILCVSSDSAAPITIVVNWSAGINPSEGATRAPH